jgi:CheY-like chemotaxis protein
LVIDDDAIATTFLREWLSSRGWQVVCARTLAEAGRCLTAARYDITLIDRRLPDGDGLAWLVDGALTSITRCLLSSGDAIDPRALPAGVAFLRKPLDVDRLQAWLAQSESNCGTEATSAAAAPVGASLLDDAQALARFGGNAAALRSLRAMLLTELRDSGPWRSQLRESAPTTAALDALHRLRAGSALTGCVRLGWVSEALEADLRRGLHANAKSVAELDAAIVATMAAIAGRE